MPAAIPLIVAVAGAALEWTALTIAIVSFAASVITNAVFVKKPKAPDLSSFLNAAGAGRTQMVRQPITPHSVGWGRYKTSGPVLFLYTKVDDEGRANGYIYIIIALAAVKIHAIRDVYLNDDLSTDPKFAGYVRISKHLGDPDQLADADFVAELPGIWTENHRGRGIAYLAVRLKWNATAFPTGVPNIGAVIDAIEEVYDPRTETTGFTNNAALCNANFLTSPYGKNMPWSKLDEASVIEAANICDERIPVRAYDWEFTADSASDVLTLDGSARSFDWGDGVRVSSDDALPDGLEADTTYYVICVSRNQIQLAATVTDAFAGNAIALDDNGSGTHLITSYDEARYKLNGSYTLDTENGEVLDQLRGAMAGHVLPRGGRWFVHAGAAVIPTFELTADHLAGPGIEVDPKRSRRDRINGMRGVYVNPDANWQPDDSPVLKPTAELLEADGGVARYGDVRNSFVTSRTQMARLMKIDLRTNRQEMSVQALFNWHALKTAPLDTGTFTHPRIFAEAQFQIVGWALDTPGINLQLQSYSATDYDWDAETEEPDETERPDVALPDGSLDVPVITITPPTTSDFTLAIAWTESINATGYDVEYSVAGAEAWTSFGQVTSPNVTIPFAGASDIRVRSVRSGATSDWGYNYAPDEPTDATLGGGEVTWTNAIDAEDVQIFGTVDGNLELRATVPGDDEVWTADASDPFHIRSVSATGNISDFVDVEV